MLRRDMVQELSHFLEPWSGDRRFTKQMFNIYEVLQPMGSGIATVNYTSPDHLRTFFKAICAEA
jgi:hypothetical protein